MVDVIATLRPSTEVANSALELLLKSSLLFVLAAAGSHSVLRTASQRRLAWALVFGIVLALPVVQLWMPPWYVPLVDVQHAALSRTITIGPLHTSVVGWAFLLWLFGATWALIRCANDLRAAHAVRNRAIPIASLESAALLCATLCDNGSEAPRNRMPQLAWTDELQSAAVIGWRHPCILLPCAARFWTPDMLRAALLHELEHVRQHDWLIMLLERLVAALYWPNPLVWAAQIRAAVAREIAADDAVMRAAVSPAQYARQLLELSRPRRGTTTLRAAVGFGGASLAPRVRALFANSRSHGVATRSTRHAIVVATLSMALPAIALQPIICR
jgi:beta-lactamase regulating signal transducer with metallopeptidase domain